MNLDAHLLVLARLRAKMERGEELDELEVAYVRWLYKAIMRAVRPFAQAVASAMGTTIEGAARRLDAGVDIAARRRILEEAMRCRQR